MFLGGGREGGWGKGKGERGKEGEMRENGGGRTALLLEKRKRQNKNKTTKQTDRATERETYSTLPVYELR